MPLNADRRCRAHTLLEVLIAMIVGLLVLAAAGALYHAQRVAQRRAEDGFRMRDAAATALMLIGQQIQMAGFRPLDVEGASSLPPLFGCSAVQRAACEAMARRCAANPCARRRMRCWSGMSAIPYRRGRPAAHRCRIVSVRVSAPRVSGHSWKTVSTHMSARRRASPNCTAREAGVRARRNPSCPGSTSCACVTCVATARSSSTRRRWALTAGAMSSPCRCACGRVANRCPRPRVMSIATAARWLRRRVARIWCCIESSRCGIPRTHSPILFVTRQRPTRRCDDSRKRVHR